MSHVPLVQKLWDKLFFLNLYTFHWRNVAKVHDGNPPRRMVIHGVERTENVSIFERFVSFLVVYLNFGFTYLNRGLLGIWFFTEGLGVIGCLPSCFCPFVVLILQYFSK